VSRLIHDFERETGLALFDREGGKLALRDEALQLYREVERLYLGLDGIARAAEDIRAANHKALRLVAVPSLAGPPLLDVTGALLAARRGMSLLLDVESTSFIAAALVNRNYDLGLCFASPRLSESITEPLCEAQAILAVPPGHPLAGREGITLAELGEERLLLPGRKTPLRQAFDALCTQQGVTVRHPAESSIANCLALAARGAGVALVDPLAAAAARIPLGLGRLAPDLTVSYIAARPPGAPRSRLVEDIVAAAGDHIRATLSALAL
jgi:DNA-binding transcriptional LysR family regulator